MVQKYCLSKRQYVEISEHNNNGKCPCLECPEKKCRGVLCTDFMPNKCKNTIDYFKGENSQCILCCRER